MTRSILLFVLAAAACGDNALPELAPDAPALPVCADLSPSCADPRTTSHVCEATGECYCDPDGRGPEPEIRCQP